jgi:hypothetical protein
MQAEMGKLHERATRAESALDTQAQAQAALDAAKSERLGKLKVNVVCGYDLQHRKPCTFRKVFRR